MIAISSITTIGLMVPVVRSTQVLATPLGSLTTIPAKMINEMPLPMPRSEICSPSHMMNAVPVVSVITVINWNPMPGWSTILPIPAALVPCSHSAMKKDWMTDSSTVP